jgi:hypothetical protein
LPYGDVIQHLYVLLLEVSQHGNRRRRPNNVQAERRRLLLVEGHVVVPAQPHVRAAGEVQHHVGHLRERPLAGRGRETRAVQAGGVRHRLAEHAGHAVDDHPEGALDEDGEDGAGVHDHPPGAVGAQVEGAVGDRQARAAERDALEGYEVPRRDPGALHERRRVRGGSGAGGQLGEGAEQDRAAQAGVEEVGEAVGELADPELRHEGQAPAAQADRAGGVVREAAVVDAAAEGDAADGDAAGAGAEGERLRAHDAGGVGAIAVDVAVPAGRGGGAVLAPHGEARGAGAGRRGEAGRGGGVVHGRVLREAELAGLALRPGEVAAGVGERDERHRRRPDGELHEVLGLARAEPGGTGVRAGRHCGVRVTR